MSLYIQSASFSRGGAWITEALPYFTRNPLGWIAAMVVFFFNFFSTRNYSLGRFSIKHILSRHSWRINARLRCS